MGSVQDRGRRHGKAWARNRAKPDELKRLVNFCWGQPSGLWAQLNSAPPAPYSHADRIAMATFEFDEERQLRDEAYELTDRLFGEDEENKHDRLSVIYLGGFAEGARAVFEEATTD